MEGDRETIGAFMCDWHQFNVDDNRPNNFDRSLALAFTEPGFAQTPDLFFEDPKKGWSEGRFDSVFGEAEFFPLPGSRLERLPGHHNISKSVDPIRMSARMTI
jgi:hypothetical protein